jgi:WW domain-binding protein 4
MSPFAASSSTSRIRASAPKDKFANYSTAAQLGFDDEDTQKTSYQIEQEIKGRAAANVGAWQEVVVPVPRYETDEAKRKRTEDAEDLENWKIRHEAKRPVHDVYDDDWDPKTALGGLRVKVREEKIFGEKKDEEDEKREKKRKREEKRRQEAAEGALDKTGWSGRLELGIGEGSEVKEEVKVEHKVEGPTGEDAEKLASPVAIPSPSAEDSAGQAAQEIAIEVKAEASDVAPASSLFKKRRPAPSARKVK